MYFLAGDHRFKNKKDMKSSPLWDYPIINDELLASMLYLDWISDPIMNSGMNNGGKY